MGIRVTPSVHAPPRLALMQSVNQASPQKSPWRGYASNFLIDASISLASNFPAMEPYRI